MKETRTLKVTGWPAALIGLPLLIVMVPMIIVIMAFAIPCVMIAWATGNYHWERER